MATSDDAPETAGPGSSGRGREELASQVRFLEAEVHDLRRRLSEGPAHSRGLELRLADAQRSLLAPSRRQNERLAADAARGARPDHDAQGGGRPAGPAAGRLRHLPRAQRGRHDRRLHRRPQAAGQREPRRSTSTPCSRARRSCSTRRSTSSPPSSSSEVGEVVMLKELLADGDRALVIGHADEERVVRLAEPLREDTDPRRRLAAARRPRPATSTSGSRSPRSRSWSSKRCRTSTTARSAAWSRRSRRSATPSSCRTCTPSCSSSTSSSRRRASCSTARPAAARP